MLTSNLWVVLSARGLVEESAARVASRPVAIVPGASATKRQQPMRALADRLASAVSLYRENRVGQILISGVDTADDPEISAMLTWLDRHQVPRSAVLIDEDGRRTRDTMANAASRFGVTSAIICTQSLHMPRSLYLARAAGIDAIGLSLPTPLSSSLRWIAIESAKNVLAVTESLVGSSDSKPSDPGRTVARR
jgi:vancomycin permeability regulator SanA